MLINFIQELIGPHLKIGKQFSLTKYSDEVNLFLRIQKLSLVGEALTFLTSFIRPNLNNVKIWISPMRGLTYTLFLVSFSILLISLPSDAEEYGNTEFYLAKSGIGDIYDLSIDEPSEATPKYWKCRDDPNLSPSVV